ncbi:hypothetical protein BDM02DRAFT_3125690 [Thelephora ganbajun]|uniref:Uncharacterized protein n=1 Tax=Thelephora ganbajun TaxID=370292 RepID=A0ACB6ZVD0_THEGA|nr:hypothetical protein BDM02DRAFT_3125690 [Thelephora ganbajun]
MSDLPGFLSRSVVRGELLRLCDPFSDEAAQAFLRSENVEWALDNTFKDTKIEFEDLDGLSWPKKHMPPQEDPKYPHLEALFGPGEPSIPTTIYENDWISVPSSPTCCQCGFDRSACQLHPRKLSRSRRTSEISLTFPQVEVPDPFTFIPIPSGWEEESELQKRAQMGESIMRPPSAKRVETQSRPFRLLELPLEEGDVLLSIGPPPGLPPPRSGFQPLEVILFPARV